MFRFLNLHTTGLANETGWWNCLAAADFDQDGDVDLVAGNLGLNYNFKASREEPFSIFSSDFDNNGKQDIVLGYYNHGKLFPWHGLLRSNFQVPFIKYNFNTYDAFGMATLEEIYGTDKLQLALTYRATRFASSYFENQGNGSFTVEDLPPEVQISSVNSILTEDVDQDGHLDLIISGNLYGSESEVTRADAGVGLFLKGDGAGNFESVAPRESGLFMEGDVKHTKLVSGGSGQDRLILVAKNNDQFQVVKIQNR